MWTFPHGRLDQNVFSNVIDQAILGGWGIRPTDWQFGASVQQEVSPRVPVEGGYFRRSFQDFFVQEMAPTSVITPRFVKIGAQIEF